MLDLVKVDGGPRYEDTDLVVDLEPSVLGAFIQPDVGEVDKFKL